MIISTATAEPRPIVNTHYAELSGSYDEFRSYKAYGEVVYKSCIAL